MKYIQWVLKPFSFHSQCQWERLKSGKLLLAWNFKYTFTFSLPFVFLGREFYQPACLGLLNGGTQMEVMWNWDWALLLLWSSQGHMEPFLERPLWLELKDFVAVTLLAFICLKCRAVFSCQSIVKTQTALDRGEDNKSGLNYFFFN